PSRSALSLHDALPISPPLPPDSSTSLSNDAGKSPKATKPAMSADGVPFPPGTSLLTDSVADKGHDKLSQVYGLLRRSPSDIGVKDRKSTRLNSSHGSI